MTQSIVGYKLLDQNGNPIQTWGGVYGQRPGIPDGIKLPNGDIVHCPQINATLSGGYKLTYWMMDEPEATPQSNFAAAIAAGLAITSTATPALNGVYTIDPSIVGVNINTIVNGINAGMGLPGGGDSFAYFDMSGTPHMFTQAQFLQFAKAIMNYVYALDLYLWGAGAHPTGTATIP
jgi:hypothetical protein